MKKPKILLTNDDGYQAAGIRALVDEFRDFAELIVVAPSWERSGAAQSLTLRQPIVCHKSSDTDWAIDGTPADCVIVALHKLLDSPPDLVISGINHGANLGENVYYSGTVGAAREGVINHVPSIAMSLCSKRLDANFVPSARLARRTAELVLKEGLPEQVLLNINVPEHWNAGGVRFTRQSKKITRNVLFEGQDPKGRPYFWLSEQRLDDSAVDANSDYAAIFAGEVSVTPLHLDPTHTESLNHLSHWAHLLINK